MNASPEAAPSIDLNAVASRLVPEIRGVPRAPAASASRNYTWSDRATLPEGTARDPFEILDAQNSERERDLIPLRWERMSVSPFTFYRGSAAVMAHDLGTAPNSGINVQLCGDAHLSNFGLFATAERRLVFDVNDFDETLPGPFEWDVKRLATSGAVAAAAAGLSPKDQRRVARSAAKGYRRTIAKLSRLTPQAVWYARLDIDEQADDLMSGSLAKAMRSATRKARSRTGESAVVKFTEVRDGAIRFRHEPPVLERVSDDEWNELRPALVSLLADYLSTIPADRIALLHRYTLVDLAHKVVGVGSVGTRALALLLATDEDAIILQAKQATRSVLEAELGPSLIPHHGHRVVTGQRVMQAAGDPFLGWATGHGRGDTHYYLRQLRDLKGSIEVERLDADALRAYLRLCGAALARAHGRSADCGAIADHIGTDSDFEEAMATYAMAYSNIVDDDFRRFTERVQEQQ